MADKLRINPALVAAITHYAEGRYDAMSPSMFVFKDANGHQSPWPIERACGLAAEVLADEDLAFLKLKMLKDGLKKAGMERLYEHIMGEKIDAGL